ncbi:9959_t:CDS:1, partial [Dentiscutata heterogama]
STKNSKKKSQDLLDDSDIEDTNIDFYLEKELDEELLQFGIEAEDIDIKNELMIENLFNIQIYKQNQEKTIKKSSIDYSQLSTNTTEDWLIDNIFKL